MKKITNKKGSGTELYFLIFAMIIGAGYVLFFIASNAPTMNFIGTTQTNIINTYELSDRMFSYLDMATEQSTKKAVEKTLENAGHGELVFGSLENHYKCGKVVYPIINSPDPLVDCLPVYENNMKEIIEHEFDRSISKYKYIKLKSTDFSIRVERNMEGDVVVLVDGISPIEVPFYVETESYYSDATAFFNKIELTEVQDASLQPEVKALLDTIAWAEGTSGPKGYQTMYTGRLFTSFEDHPRTKICADSLGSNICSTAAGRYQFLGSTWDDVARKLNLEDFSPKNQDLGAVQLIREKGGLEKITSGDFEGTVIAIRKVWASLPGAGYGQPEKKMSKLKGIYDARLEFYNTQAGIEPTQELSE